MTVDLRVDLCGVHLDGPLLLGSGGLGESDESLLRFQETACAAVVTRTLRTVVRPERARFPSPHLALDPHRRWLLNCEWGNLRPLDYWLATGLPNAVARGPVIASVSGRDPEDCVRTVETLAGSGAALYEINFSCSHAGELDGRITDDARHVARVIGAVKECADAPVIAKLGWSPALRTVAESVATAGGDAIAVTNSIGPGLDVDLTDGRPRLGVQGGIGGVSGPAIFPIALRCVSEVADAVDLPVIGVGGVSSYEDVVKMLMVGATCVQIYTAPLLRGPEVFNTVTDRLRDHLRRQGMSSLRDLRGLSAGYLRSPSRTRTIVPIVDTNRCHPCGACVDVCGPRAITLSDTAVIDAHTCTGCGICIDVCPPRFDALRAEGPP